MDRYRIKFSYERVLDDEVTELDEDLAGTLGIIDVSSGVVEVATVAEGKTLAEVFQNMADFFGASNGLGEERLERSIETMIEVKKSEGKEIKRIKWVEED